MTDITCPECGSGFVYEEYTDVYASVRHMVCKNCDCDWDIDIYGISCGQVALERAGITYENYYASEINKYAIQITQRNYSNTIQLGDVTCVTAAQLSGKINLLIGGSPCQGFSFAGKGLNFADPRSKLFFEFVRLRDELKPKYFLLENVLMKHAYRDTISELLGVEPIQINSALVSAQSRERLYWTNISIDSMPQDKGIMLSDVLEKDIPSKYYLSNSAIEYITKRKCDYVVRGKSPTLTTELAHLWGYRFTPRIVKELGVMRRLMPIECERLQTLPDNYTAGISDTQRYHALGNCWTVDVITHIFQGLHNG